MSEPEKRRRMWVPIDQLYYAPEPPSDGKRWLPVQADEDWPFPTVGTPLSEGQVPPWTEANRHERERHARS